jgi:hypothetical protein
MTTNANTRAGDAGFAVSLYAAALSSQANDSISGYSLRR